MASPITSSTQTQASKSSGRLIVTAGYFIAFIVLGMTTASLGPTLTGLAAHLNTTLGQMSYLFTVRSLGYLGGSFLSGRLYDRFPAHPVLAAIILLMGGMLFLAPIMPVLVLLGAVLLLVGVCEGFVDVGGNTLLVWVHREEVGPFMNALHFFFGVGAFLSPLIVAQAVLLSGDITWAYWAIATLMLPVAIFLLRLPSPRPMEGEAGQAARRTDMMLVGLIAGFFFLYTGAEASMGGWIYAYGLGMHLADEISAAYLTSGFWGALTVGRLLSIPLAARLRPRTLLLADLIGVAASLLLVLAFPGSLAALWVGAMGTGLFMAAIFPTMLALAGRQMVVTGKITGWFLVGASIGGMSQPWIIGQLFAPVGPRAAIFTIASGVVLALGLFAVILARIQRHGETTRT